LQNLSQDYETNIEEINSNWIRDHLLGYKKVSGRKVTVFKITHPAKQYGHLFSEEDPQVAVTYQWSLGLDNKSGLLSFVKDKDQNLRIWLDILFIDQMSENIPLNLAKAQEVYGLSDQHWVFGTDKLLSRGWCLFEICLSASQNRQSLILGDLGSSVSSRNSACL